MLKCVNNAYKHSYRSWRTTLVLFLFHWNWCLCFPSENSEISSFVGLWLEIDQSLSSWSQLRQPLSSLWLVWTQFHLQIILSWPTNCWLTLVNNYTPTNYSIRQPLFLFYFWLQGHDKIRLFPLLIHLSKQILSCQTRREWWTRRRQVIKRWTQWQMEIFYAWTGPTNC